MAHVEKSVLIEAAFRYENMAQPGETPVMVRVCTALYLNGLWDEEGERWVYKPEPAARTLNDLVPGDRVLVDSLIQRETTELSTSVQTFKDEHVRLSSEKDAERQEKVVALDALAVANANIADLERQLGQSLEQTLEAIAQRDSALAKAETIQGHKDDALAQVAEVKATAKALAVERDQALQRAAAAEALPAEMKADKEKADS